jgi:hypothetical protein
VLSHKIACIGRSQARLFESWGNAAQTEIVGVPRFDRSLGRAPRVRRPDEPFAILVLTAKWPGFNEEQWRRASQSLKDLKRWLDEHPYIGGQPVTSLWRITQGLEQEVGVDNSLRDTTGQDLAAELERDDAVVTTPSTTMLEGMLQQVPVALLDYNNCPHYVPAAWSITAQPHFDQVIPELLAPPPAKMLYQQHLLHDALECVTPARPRMAELITRMSAHARHELAQGRTLCFPPRMLLGANEAPSRACAIDYARLFPSASFSTSDDVARLQLELADLRDSLAAASRQIEDARAAYVALDKSIAEERARRDKRLRRLPLRVGRMVREFVAYKHHEPPRKSA